MSHNGTHIEKEIKFHRRIYIKIIGTEMAICQKYIINQEVRCHIVVLFGGKVDCLYLAINTGSSILTSSTYI